MATLQVIFLLIVGCLFSYGPQLSSAVENQETHEDVYDKLCEDLSNVCPCVANNLIVTEAGKEYAEPWHCGLTVPLKSLRNVLSIKPPAHAKIDKDSYYFVTIWDRDAPSRWNPEDRYLLIALYTNIIKDDLEAGILENGLSFHYWESVRPKIGTGAHTYQMVMFRQSLSKLSSHSVVQPQATCNIQALARKLRSRISRSKSDLPSYFKQLKLCDQLPENFIGAFEFYASSPDYLDPAVNLTRNCPFSPFEKTRAAGRSTAGSVYGDGLLRLVAMITACAMLLQ